MISEKKLLENFQVEDRCEIESIQSETEADGAKT